MRLIAVAGCLLMLTGCQNILFEDYTECVVDLARADGQRVVDGREFARNAIQHCQDASGFYVAPAANPILVRASKYWACIERAEQSDPKALHTACAREYRYYGEDGIP